MYAVVQVGSHQYKIEEGDQIKVNQFDAEIGKTVHLNDVLLFADGKDVRIGQPFLKDVKVSAKVADQTLGKKVVAFQYRRRKSSAKKKGHRQKLMVLNITKISA